MQNLSWVPLPPGTALPNLSIHADSYPIRVHFVSLQGERKPIIQNENPSSKDFIPCASFCPTFSETLCHQSFGTIALIGCVVRKSAPTALLLMFVSLPPTMSYSPRSGNFEKSWTRNFARQSPGMKLSGLSSAFSACVAPSQGTSPQPIFPRFKKSIHAPPALSSRFLQRKSLPAISALHNPSMLVRLSHFTLSAGPS